LIKKIAVSGCGWLGFPLAKHFIKKGHTVHGSTTSLEKKEALENAGIYPFILSLSEKCIQGDISSFLNNIDVLIINIPPKLRKEGAESYVLKMLPLIKEIEAKKIKQVIFISSTSVYGNEDTLITEETKTSPETKSGKQLVQVEQLLLNNTNFKTSVVRFGGLIGPDRHPVNSLAGKKNIKNPEAPLNLIHLDDCIGIISAILQKEAFPYIFNGVFPEHPLRKEYYTQKAMEKKLPLPLFETSGISKGKTIISEKVKSVLNYSFTTKI